MSQNDIVMKSAEIRVTDANVKAFVEATRKSGEQTRKEPGNLRFDLLQDSENPTHFVLIEAYKNDEALKAHRATTHYHEWRQVAEPLMIGRRVATHYNVLVSDLK